MVSDVSRRISVVGAGPSGFYAAGHFLNAGFGGRWVAS
jgi:cation diffusion facilitator CzcD-associated flavoprotein CzcO